MQTLTRFTVGVGSVASPDASVAAWTPTSASIPLLAWYRADVGVTDVGGGEVSTVLDQSPAGDANRNLTSDGMGVTLNAADAAYGNQATLSFDGATSLLRDGDWLTAPDVPISIVIVGEGSYATSFICDGAVGPPYNLIWSAGAGLQAYNGTAITGGSATTPCIMLYEDDGVTANLYVTDLSTPVATDATVFTTGTGFDLGLGNAGVSKLLGKEAEVIIFNGVLSSIDKDNLKTYFSTTRAYGLDVFAGTDFRTNATLLTEHGRYVGTTWTTIAAGSSDFVAGYLAAPDDSLGYPVFAGAEDLISDAGTVGDHWGGDDFSGFVVVTPSPVTAPNAAPWLEEGIISDYSYGAIGIAASDLGGGDTQLTFWYWSNLPVANTTRRADVTVPTGVKCVFHFRYHWDAGTVDGYIQVGVNGVWQPSIATTGSTDPLTYANAMRLGASYAPGGPVGFVGSVHDIGLYSTIMNDQFFVDATTKYG